MTRRYFEKKAAPASSLNQPVQPGRLIRFLRLDVARMKEAAHAHEGKINDVVLTLWAGGLRRLLRHRGEPVAGVELISGMPVSLRSDETIDNQVGTMVLALPVWQDDPSERLELIARRTRTAKTEQQPAAIMGYMAGLAATPIGRYYTTHQRASNVIVTNVMGPSVPVYVLGAQILEVLPIIELVGNIGLTLCAFSYSGEMVMVVTADATAFPDLDVLMVGMGQDWDTLTRRRISAAVLG
jgi:WS/DGAT/MGAT family acyltransferase